MMLLTSLWNNSDNDNDNNYDDADDDDDDDEEDDDDDDEILFLVSPSYFTNVWKHKSHYVLVIFTCHSSVMVKVSD